MARSVDCPTCGETFETAHHSKRFCGLPCRRVHRETYEAEWRAANPEKLRATNMRPYGITPERYDEMLVEQGGGCAICGGTNESGRALAVDHNHVTRVVRGLLCDRHNVGIGMFRDDVDDVLAAASYLAAHADRRIDYGSVLPEGRRRAPE